jgi:hypothetical protein
VSDTPEQICIINQEESIKHLLQLLSSILQEQEIQCECGSSNLEGILLTEPKINTIKDTLKEYSGYLRN